MGDMPCWRVLPSAGNVISGFPCFCGGNLVVGATLKYGRVAQPQRSVEPMKRSLMFTLPRLGANLEPPWTGLVSKSTQGIFYMSGCFGQLPQTSSLLWVEFLVLFLLRWIMMVM